MESQIDKLEKDLENLENGSLLDIKNNSNKIRKEINKLEKKINEIKIQFETSKTNIDDNIDDIDLDSQLNILTIYIDELNNDAIENLSLEDLMDNYKNVHTVLNSIKKHKMKINDKLNVHNV